MATRPMSSGRVPDVVVVGSAARDVAAADARGWRLGGGVSYGALTLARLGLRTGVVVGVDDVGSSADELRLLASSEATVHVERLGRSPVFENVETPTGRVQTCLEPGLPLPVAAVPSAFRSARRWLLAPVAGELGEAWADIPPGDALVALAWQGLLRHLPRGGLTSRRSPAPNRLLTRADIVAVSRHDVEPGTSPAALYALLKPGATLLLTEGTSGGLRFSSAPHVAAAEDRWRAFAAAAEIDATGAGDVFLAAYLAAHAGVALGSPPGDGGDLRLAAASASLVVEGPGLAGVPTASAVAARLRSPRL